MVKKETKRKPLEKILDTTEDQAEQKTAEQASESSGITQPKTTPPNLTQEEAAVFQRVKSEADDWKTITEGDVEDFSLMADPFDLPEPAKEMLNRRQFAFRWAEMKPSRIDELRNASVPLKWWICNSIQTPFLDGFFDPIHGGVQKLDQLLLFKPYWMHQRVIEAKTELADSQDRTGDLKQREGKDPEKGVEWSSGEGVKITDSDVIMDPGGTLEQAYGEEQTDASELGDLVVE